MHPIQQRLRQLQPGVFNHSLDWRFLLPLSNADKTFVLFEEDPEFSQTLEQVGIPVSNQPSFLDIEQREKKDGNSVVFPFGLPVRWVGGESADQIEFFRSMRKFFGDHGNLMVGFNNSWSLRSNNQSKYHSSTPYSITSQMQRAGFKTIKVFGVMPNLSIPEYIFDLDMQPMSFAFQHRFKRKPAVLKFIQLLSHTIGLTHISNLLPCYFVVAAV